MLWRQALCLLLLAIAGGLHAEVWPQWGGPGRDFHVGDPGLATDWSKGLPELWSRPLGEGYSGIAVVGSRVFTQYSSGEVEFVVALSADTGEELWRYRYEAPRAAGMRLNYGEGPHSTPLVVDGRLFAVGTTGQLLALSSETGELLWRLELWGEYGGFRLRRGYGASPIAWKSSVVVPVGGDAPGMIAFSQADGAVVWQSEPFDSAQSSPVLVEVDGGTHLVQFIQDEIVGLDPENGDLLWRHAHKAMGPYNITTPVAGGDGTIFISSSYGGGSRLLQLSNAAEGTRVEEVWHSKRMAIHFTNALKMGDHVLASTGRSSVFAAALDATTGELAWKSRLIGRASYLRLGKRFLALEADGRLILGELEESGPAILAETQLLESQSWTVPTLVENRLYVRTRDRIVAVELPLTLDGGS